MKTYFKNHTRSFIFWGIWLLLFFTSGNFGLMGRLFSSSNKAQQTVMEDLNMTTDLYHTEIQIQEDNSYLISEEIKVSFDSPRHGIYRYVPQKGIITEMKEDGSVVDIPYYAYFDSDKVKSSVPVEISEDNGNEVFCLGDSEVTVDGEQEYRLQYQVSPITSKGYENVYYNVFPTGWQNEIPVGSNFVITFPKSIPEEALQIYYGRYGERMDGHDIVNLTWNGNTVSGELTEALPVGTGMTFYVPMEAGYFHSVNTSWPENLSLICIAVIAFLILTALFFLFGKERAIIPSIQFQPPKGLDSAAVGYIVDGNVSDADVISLILYWADKGYLKIRETKKSTLAFTKLKQLPEDAPEYEHTLFEGIFGRYAPIGTAVVLSNLKYKTAKSFSEAKEQIAKSYSHKVYTRGSKIARIASIVLSSIPLFIFTGYLVLYTMANALVFLLPVLYFTGVLLFSRTVDYWYSRAKSSRFILGSVSVAMSMTSVIAFILVYGIGMIRGTILNFFPGLVAVSVVSFAGFVTTGFMKKRTEECIEWMGYLAGLRDFIETAELERMQVIAQESPQLFYHILPFAYVFGLTDVLLDKMKDLTLPAPEWYETRSGNMTHFDYYLMHRMMHADMRQVTTTISTPKPVESSSGSSGGFSGGGSSGGGFSGGGFGGGGGGSW